MKKVQRHLFKIKKFMKYSLKEQAVYSTISAFSGGDGICRLPRKSISDLSGVSDLDTISKYTSKFEKDGLLKKLVQIKGARKIVTYKVISPDKDYQLVSSDIFGGDPSLLGFICLFAENKYRNTNEINLTNKEIMEKMGICKKTFYKYIKLAETANFIKRTTTGYELNENIFPIIVSDKERTKSKIETKIENILQMDGSRAKKILLQYYDPCIGLFSDRVGNVNGFLDYCLSGVPRKNKEKSKEFEKIDIKF